MAVACGAAVLLPAGTGVAAEQESAPAPLTAAEPGAEAQRAISPVAGANAPASPAPAGEGVAKGEALGTGVLIVPRTGALVPGEPPGGRARDGTGPRPSTETTPAVSQADTTGFRFRLAPIRWSGNLSDSLAWTNVADQPSHFQHIQTGNLRGATYLWQPWFAQLTATLGFVTGTERTSGSGSDFGGSGSGRGTSLTGGATLSLFPASRFPFSASFERSDSRASSVATSEDFTNTRVSLRQDYTPLNGRTRYSFGYDRSIIDSTVSGRDTVDVVRGSMSASLDKHTFDLNANHTANRTEAGSNQFNFDNLNVHHTWVPLSNLTVDNLLSASRSSTTASSDSVSLENRSSFVELSSFTNWQPETERPLLVTGSARLFRLTADAGEGQSESRSIAGGLSANYSLSEHVSVFGSTQLSQVSTGTDSNFLTVTSAGGTYSSDVISLGKFSYTWNANTNGTLQTGGEDGSQNLLLAGLGHNLVRNLWTDQRSSMAVSFGQSLTATRASLTGSQVSLGNSANASYSLRQSESFYTTLSTSVSDSHSFGANATDFQQVSFQANGNMLFSRYSTGAANFSVTGIRQDTPDDPDKSLRWSAFGTLGYQHARAFNVPQLRYSLLYTANTLQLGSREQGNPDATRDRVTQALEQRLDYRIGRLDLQALFRLAYIDGKRNAFLFFRINRDFGTF